MGVMVFTWVWLSECCDVPGGEGVGHGYHIGVVVVGLCPMGGYGF